MAVAGRPRRRTGAGPAVVDGLAALASLVVTGLVLLQHERGAEVFAPLPVAVLVVLLAAVAWALASGRGACARARALEHEALLVHGERDAQTAAVLEQERARIARELHDVVGHHVCLIVAQARAGRVVLQDDPAAAVEALRCVEGTGREALVELRRLLDVLPTAEQEPAAAVPPRLDQLAGLVAQVGGAGLPAELEVRGIPRRLPAGLELDAYRIVQESLTNALRHGPRTRTRVVLTYGTQELEVEVDDSGSPALAAPAPGRGLSGMRQRAALLGGHVTAGPGRDGGFTVTARLPTDVVA